MKICVIFQTFVEKPWHLMQIRDCPGPLCGATVPATMTVTRAAQTMELGPCGRNQRGIVGEVDARIYVGSSNSTRPVST